MYNVDSADGGKYLFPGDARTPDWVVERMNAFRTGIYEVVKLSSDPNKETISALLRLLQMHIIPPGIKIKKRLSKGELKEFLKQYDEHLDDDTYTWWVWMLMNAGFLLSTILPSSLNEDSFQLPPNLIAKREEITRSYLDNKDDPNAKFKYMKDLESLSKEVLDWMEEIENPIYDMVGSKANGTLTHIQELLLGIGLSLNAKGEITDIITSSLLDGVEPTEYFNNSSQAIQALYAKSAETAKPGYLGKKLSNICERTKLSRQKDCGTQNKLEIKSSNALFLETFIGQNFSTSKSGGISVFSESHVKKYLGKKLFFRSSLYCRATDGVCANCYNIDYINAFEIKPGDNIGLNASTGITGSLVNLTLKKSHTGVSLDRKEVNLLEDLKDIKDL